MTLPAAKLAHRTFPIIPSAFIPTNCIARICLPFKFRPLGPLIDICHISARYAENMEANLRRLLIIGLDHSCIGYGYRRKIGDYLVVRNLLWAYWQCFFQRLA